MDARIRIELRPTGLRTNLDRDDYEFQPGVGEVPEPVRTLASRWNDALLTHAENRSFTILQRYEEDWWLLLVRRESRRDRHNRIKTSQLFGRLPDAPPTMQAQALLEAYSRSAVTAATAPANLEFVAQQPGSCDRKALAQACVRVALGENAALRPGAGPGAFLDHRTGVGLDAVRWIARIHGPLPALPPDGPGLFIAEPYLGLPDPILAMLNGTPAEELLRYQLADLARLPDSPEVRLELFRLILGGPDPASPLSVQALVWLARLGNQHRKQAFRLVSQQALVAWLPSVESVKYHELRSLRERLTLPCKELGGVINCILQEEGSSEASLFDRYHGLLPEDPEPRHELLPEEQQVVWNYLHGDKVEPLSAHKVNALLESLGQHPQLRVDFKLGRLANLNRPEFPRIRDLFRKALVARGMNENVVGRLLGIHALPVPTTPERPALEPDHSWLRGIAAEAMLLVESAFDPAWWQKCVRILLDKQLLPRKKVLEYATLRKHGWLLELAGADPALGALVLSDSDRFAVPVAEEDWPVGAADLLTEVYRQGKLWERLLTPLTDEGLRWLPVQMKDHELGKRLEKQATDLLAGLPLPTNELPHFAHLLRDRLLRQQILAQVRDTTWSVSRCEKLDLLLQPDCMAEDKRLWLRTLLFTCQPVGADLTWTVEELLDLFTLFPGRAERLVRDLFDRGEPLDENQAGRLATLIESDWKERLVWLPQPEPEAISRQPHLYNGLAKHLGWSQRIVARAQAPRS